MAGDEAVLPERIQGDGVLLRRWLVSDGEAAADDWYRVTARPRGKKQRTSVRL